MTSVYCADYMDPKKQNEAGRVLTQYVLREYYDVDTHGLELAYSERGKPYFTDLDLHFNISHSSGKVVLAVSHAPVGVDIEIERRIRRHIGERFLGISTDNPKKLLSAWVKRESYGKMTGEGFFYSEPCVQHYFKEYRCQGALGNFLICACSTENSFAKELVEVRLPVQL